MGKLNAIAINYPIDGETRMPTEYYYKILDELEELRAKKKPIKVIIDSDRAVFECPNCIKNGINDSVWMFTEIGEYNYCPRCGQALDWSEKE